MIRKVKVSILVAALASAVASEARAGFTYDLRLAPVSAGINDGAGITVVDAHDATITSPTPITMQLWGQITGTNGTSTDEFWTSGFVGVSDTQVGGGALNSGGITQAAVNTGANGFIGNTGAQKDINSDGILDWGSTTTSTNTGWMTWSNGTIAAGGQAGLAGGGSAGEAVGSGWEILIGTFTIGTSGLTLKSGTGSTVFNVPSVPTLVKTSALGATGPGLVYYQDGSSVFAPNGITIGSGVTLGLGGAPVPEPASLGVLALGGLALLARRRK